MGSGTYSGARILSVERHDPARDRRRRRLRRLAILVVVTAAVALGGPSAWQAVYDAVDDAPEADGSTRVADTEPELGG